MDQAILVERIEHWIQAFSQTLNQWEDWIEQTQVAFLNADYGLLRNLQSTGEETLRLVRERYAERKSLLDLALESGLHCKSLQDVAKSLWGETGNRIAQRLSASGQRMRRLQQMSLAVWITAFESSVHSAQFLQILSTGDSDSATYSPTENESIGGGRLVNQAA